MIDLTFRAFSRARWIAVATSKGVYDAAGNVQAGFEVDELGNAVLTSGTYTVQGVVITPAVIDTWYWVHLRVYNAASVADVDALYAGEVEDGFKFTKSKLAAFVRNQATLVPLILEGQSIKTYEFGTLANRIELLDPRQYNALRRREWAGGMNF